MSGHSKWANIQHRKGRQDEKRGKVFTKAAKEIIIAAKAGGDPAGNSRLRAAIAAAKAVNLPKDRIQAAIRKGTGEDAGGDYTEGFYEGYGPGGIAIMVEVATDNKNRTVADVRHLFSKHGGSLGTEEIETITPAIQAANKEKILAFGPYSPDGFFSIHMQGSFDAVLAMYHDQGLIPFKALAFDSGVNFTAGLPIVRTSPDHGTGYDIAGKNKALPGPMQRAIFAAIDLSLNRRRFDQMYANPLEVKRFEGPKYEKTILPE